MIKVSQPVVRLRHVCHRYGDTVASDAVTLDIPTGKLIGFIGPDGTGKSTLLGLISGARKMQRGAIEVLGGDMSDPKHRERVCPRIAYMPQGLGKNLYATLSVFENVDFFGRLFRTNASGAQPPHRGTAREHQSRRVPAAPCGPALIQQKLLDGS